MLIIIIIIIFIIISLAGTGSRLYWGLKSAPQRSPMYDIAVHSSLIP